MKVKFKISLISILFFFLFINCVNASGIVMNLENNVNNQTNANVQENSSADANTVNTVFENNTEENPMGNNEDEITDTAPALTSTETTSNNDDFLTTENILSIIIIVIGILLIFLAVAILIRFK